MLYEDGGTINFNGQDDYDITSFLNDGNEFLPVMLTKVIKTLIPQGYSDYWAVNAGDSLAIYSDY